MDIENRIKSLEIASSISNIHPLKIVGGFVLISACLIIGYIVWYKPDYVCNEKRELSTNRCIQFTLAITVLLGCISYLLWNFFQG